jgi:hypothetical protein
MQYILKNTSLRCTSLSNNMYGWNIQYFQRKSFPLPLVRHHPNYKNQLNAIQGRNALAGCTLQLGNTNNFCSIQPTAHYLLWKGQQLCRACKKSFKHVLVFLHFTKAQHTIHCRKQGCFQGAWSSPKKTRVQDTAFFSASAFQKFQLRFHAQSVLFPCKCVTVFQQGSAFKAKYRWCLEKV